MYTTETEKFQTVQSKGPKGLKGRAVYEIDYNAKGIPNNVIPILDTFIARKNQKSISIMFINQSDETKWIPQGQHIGTVHLVKGRTQPFIIDEYSDIFSKDQYIRMSTHPLVEIPTEGPPCISALYTIPHKFRPWVDNTINKLLEAGMIQCTMSTWASLVITVPKKKLEVKPEDAKKGRCQAKISV